MHVTSNRRIARWQNGMLEVPINMLSNINSIDNPIKNFITLSICIQVKVCTNALMSIIEWVHVISRHGVVRW